MIVSLIDQEEHVLTYEVRKDRYATPRYPIVLCHGFSGFDHFFQLPMFSQAPPMPDKFKHLFDSRIESSLPSASLSSRSTRITHFTPQDETIRNMGIDNKSVFNNGKYLIEYWNGIKTVLKDHGCNVLVAKVPPFASIETRATMLDRFIRDSIPHIREKTNIPEDEPVKLNLIAHSMGGLDCRYLIHQNKRFPSQHYQIVSLTTISTPHRGTSAANFALKFLPATMVQNSFPSIFQLSTDYAYQFNFKVRDDPDVKYFSYGAKMNPSPTSMFLVTWKIINDIEGPNDGMVSLRSCKWGKFQGYLEDVDHADLINWMGIVKKTKMALGVPNFNPEYFYLDIVNNLALYGL